MGVILCSAKEACELMSHIDENDIVILTVINKKKDIYVHDKPEKIKKKNGEDLIKQAEDIFYQDNNFFGRLSLYGVLKEENIIHNILFPQMG